MEQYISKSALVAGIEKLKCNLCPDFYEYNYDAAKVELLEKIENFINTLKVKEVQEEPVSAKNPWKPADGDCLPEIDREVIALLDNGKVVYAHRPSEHWDGKNIDTGKVTRYYPKTYDKGGWNIPNLKYWLDYPLPE
jgi:hypothetical protein